MGHRPERSPLFEMFLAGVHTPAGLSRDLLDELPGSWALSRLTGDERTEAEDILIAGLAENDGRAATALADAGAVRAIPALIERTTPSAPPVMRVFAARALLRLGDLSGRDALLDLLRSGAGSHIDRSTAVTLLSQFPDTEREFTRPVILETALRDASGLVRSQAISALFSVHGLAGEEMEGSELLGSIHSRLLSPLASLRDEAEAELRVLLDRIGAEGTPGPQRSEEAEGAGPRQPDTDLMWRPDPRAEPLRSLFAAAEPDEGPGRVPEYPLEGLAGLTGRERRAAEDFLLVRLPFDDRAVRAVGRLGVRRAVEPLRELLRTTAADATVRDDALAALRVLTGDDGTAADTENQGRPEDQRRQDG
ncbi:HEAT repeat domain-containing protein [Streptomyces sp. NPDC059785]|uniref:HEAT repeat domain-containing protein n=1 Tax=unclassified Streptomyces TaxID=2593676 RepID=UPI0036681444